jgi:hypothetical protein
MTAVLLARAWCVARSNMGSEGPYYSLSDPINVKNYIVAYMALVLNKYFV